ncbi:MAG: ligase-associated DNA damage response endonuclease PdeM [Sphingobacteriia bacterium]|nr:ligase-associated DNA damage response endonuclease PdeM [Sphingobacteriia bacterium]
MQQPVPFILAEQQLWLSEQRCIFWETHKALIVSDIHFGKTGHFRKSGIAIPQAVFKEDLQRLVDCISFFKAEQLIVVGDLFHSIANKELDLFVKWRNDLSHLHIHLIKGNHDILKDEWYASAGIQITEHRLQMADFCFVHSIEEINLEEEQNNFFFSGHIHPGISIKGNSKQTLRFPCFYFTKQYAVLPAFSRFTGLAAIKPKKNEKVFAIVNENVMSLND